MRVFQFSLLLLSGLMLIPLGIIYVSLLFPETEVWAHLFSTVLTEYVFNSILLAVGTGCVTMIVGTYLGWCIARYDFLGRSWLQWGVLLPLAMPAYIAAYTYTGLLDFGGAAHQLLANLLAKPIFKIPFPDIRSLSGAIVLLGLVLYPYVYLLSRMAFAEQSARFEEVSVSLGKNQHQHFFSVTLPLVRPAIAIGTLLTMMEALSDYGTVEYFGIQTFTTGIFRTWFGLGNPATAAQLSALLCTMVLLLLGLEHYSRRHLKVYTSSRSQSTLQRIRLSGWKSIGVFTLAFLPMLLGFLIPFIQLICWAWRYFPSAIDAEFRRLAWHSFSLAVIGAVTTVLCALFFAYGRRLLSNKWVLIQIQVASLGYALPGTVIAVGVLLPLIWLDRQISAVFTSVLNWSPGLLFSGSIAALLIGYLVRFLMVAIQHAEAGLARITPSMDSAAASLGNGAFQILRRVHVPIVRGSLISAVLLVFVEILKELPATLILRPFNYNTLAVRTYELASDERLVDAALPALMIVLVGLIPVILLTKSLDVPENSPGGKFIKDKMITRVSISDVTA